jgi:hypothetical protein
LTYFNPLISRFGLIVTPVITLLRDVDPHQLKPNPDEVEAIFTVPLEFFLKDEKQEVHEYQSSTGHVWKFHSFDWVEKKIKVGEQEDGKEEEERRFYMYVLTDVLVLPLP